MARLESAGVPSHALAAELLLMHALDRDRTSLYTHPEDEIPPATLEKFQALIAQRAERRPHAISDRQAGILGTGFRSDSCCPDSPPRDRARDRSDS